MTGLRAGHEIAAAVRTQTQQLADRIVDSMRGEGPPLLAVLHDYTTIGKQGAEEARLIDATKFGDLEACSSIEQALLQLAIEVRKLKQEAAPLPEPQIAHPHAPRVYCTFIRSARPVTDPRHTVLEHGELVLVQLPVNVTIHEGDGQRAAEIFSLAMTIGTHWRDQGGLAASQLDQLAALFPKEQEGDERDS